MKRTKILQCFLFLICFSITALQAQSVNSTSGGNATGSGGSVSYTVGQIAYSSFSGSNGKVTQGVQQPYEISVVTAINK